MLHSRIAAHRRAPWLAALAASHLANCDVQYRIRSGDCHQCLCDVPNHRTARTSHLFRAIFAATSDWQGIGTAIHLFPSMLLRCSVVLDEDYDRGNVEGRTLNDDAFPRRRFDHCTGALNSVLVESGDGERWFERWSLVLKLQIPRWPSFS